MTKHAHKALTLGQIWRTVSESCLEKTGRTTAEEILTTAWTLYPKELKAERDQATRQGYLRQIKQIMGEKEVDDGVDDERSFAQMGLPGFALPSAFAVLREDGEFDYVQPESMTWADLQQAKLVRENNLERAQKRLLDLELKMEVLKPYMINNPKRTMLQAARLYRQAQQRFEERSAK